MMCGDSTSTKMVIDLIQSSKVELCFTSPPYADQRDYRGQNNLNVEHIATFIRACSSHVNYFAINLGYSRKNWEVNPYWDDYIKESKNCGLKFLSWNIWNKGECGSIGNQTAMFGISHEWIFVFGKEAKDLNRTLENKSAGQNGNQGNRQADGTIKKSHKDYIIASHSQLKTIYDCVAQKARDDIDHPARFPVQFAHGYIEAMTNYEDFIYEPFGGSGSTLIACENINRRCFIMELDPHYCDVILNRYFNFSKKTIIRSDGAQWVA